MAKPLIGLIVPPRGSFLPPDAARFYGERADFAVEGLGIDEMAVADFDAAAGRVGLAARALGERGVHSIVPPSPRRARSPTSCERSAHGTSPWVRRTTRR